MRVASGGAAQAAACSCASAAVGVAVLQALRWELQSRERCGGSCAEGDTPLAIAALRSLFNELSLWREDRKLYARCYYRVRGEVVLFGLFNAVHILHRRTAGLLCDSTEKLYSFVVVLEGSVFMSVDNKANEALEPGKTLFLDARYTWQVHARGTVAQPATVAFAFFEPLERRPNRKHLEKTVQELADSMPPVKSFAARGTRRRRSASSTPTPPGAKRLQRRELLSMQRRELLLQWPPSLAPRGAKGRAPSPQPVWADPRPHGLRSRRACA